MDDAALADCSQFCGRRGGLCHSGRDCRGRSRSGTTQRHELLITRLCGVMFIGFAISALAHALPGLDECCVT